MDDPRSSNFWVAGHITTCFYIVDSPKSTLEKGSCGFGLNLNRGVKTQVFYERDHTKPGIYFDNTLQKPGIASVSESVLELMREISPNIPEKVVVNHIFEAPLGSGFGTSAAGSLGLAFGLNHLFELNLSEIELWQIAHQAEIRNTSGLGDVLGLYSNSQVEIRLKPGAPGIGLVKPITLNFESYDIYSVIKGPLSTQNILLDPIKREKINDTGKKCVEGFQHSPTIDNFFKFSNDFSNEVELLSKELKDVVLEMNDVYWAQIMLGDGLLLFCPKHKTRLINKFNSLQLSKESLTKQTVMQLSN